MLTPKQAKFAKEFLNCNTATEAAIKAGYSPKYADRAAYQVKQKKEVKRIIEKNRVRMEKAYIYSAQKKLEILQQGIEECAGEGKWKDVSSLTKVHNDMMGDNAPTKTINVNIEATAEEIEQLRLKYQKDY